MAGSWTRALGASAALLCAPELEAASLDWRQSSAGNFDYGRQLTIPAGFGSGEFTLEVWVRPNNSFPVGSTAGGGQLTNWSSEDFAPYSSGGWWFNGNFLLDGHNNAGSNFQNGTFSLQLYGGGRVRWLFGDGASGGLSGDLWAVQASQTSSAPSLLDGDWHHVALVRRFSGASQSTLELWVDGTLIDTETSSARTNMATTYWNNWTGFPSGQQGWFWGAEKQAAIGVLSQYEDYKGLIDELRFWSRAKTSTELGTTWESPVTGSEPGLVGWYDFSEGSGSNTCSSIVTTQCMSLQNAPNAWNAGEAPTMGGGGDTTAPTVPTGLVATPASSTTINLSWTASSDVGGTGVSSYRVMRGGSEVAPAVAGTSYSDTGLTANSTYSYTVSAVDVAGNRSGESTAAQATTPPAADTTAPSVPGSFAATATSSTSISLSWSASTDNVGVTGYLVRRGGTLIGSPTGLSFVDNGRTPSTTYNYTVTAVDAAGNESATAAASATTPAPPADTTPPTVPGNFTASATSTTSITLAWTASTDNVSVIGYRVRRAGNATVIASPAGLGFIDNGRTPGTTYNYTVTAVDAAGNESTTASASATTPAPPADTTPPTEPGSFTATATSSTSISLSWTPSTDNVGVTGYQVRRDGTLIGVSTGSSFIDSGRTASTTFNYTILAVDAAGNESTTASASATTPGPPADTTSPSTPGSFAATATSSTSISLSWTASTDNVAVTGYRVRRGGTLISSPTGLSFLDTGRTPSTTYNYTVTAVDAAGNESATAAASATTQASPADMTPPTVPGNFTATATSSTSISLAWTVSTDTESGVIGYRVRRAGNATVIASPSGLSFIDNGRTPSTTYNYTVTAVDAAGNESATTAASATTLAPPADTAPPTVPGNFAATATSSTSVSLSWAASTDNVAVTGYRVRRAGNAIVIANPTGLSFVDAGRTPSTLYNYTITAVDAAGNESTSATASATTPAPPADMTPPTVPGNFTATATSMTSISLAWTASTDNVGVTGYRVRRAGDATVIASPTGLSFVDNGRTPSTIYNYTVTAVDAAGNESNTATASATTPAPPADTAPPTVPGNFVAAPTSSTSISLSWNAATDNVGVTGYRLRRAGTVIASSTGLSFVDSGRTPSTTYDYTVSAVDAAGNESTTASASATTFPVTADTTAPSAPGNFTATATSSILVTLTWTASADNVGVTGYEVRRDNVLVGSPTGLSFSDNGRIAGQTYNYTVLALDAAGNESARASASATTPAIPGSGSSSSSGGGSSRRGGSLDLLTMLAGLTALWIRARRREYALRAVRAT